MHTASRRRCGKARQVAPFVLLSLLLHAALIFFIRPSIRNPPTARPHPLEVYFSAPAPPEPISMRAAALVPEPSAREPGATAAPEATMSVPPVPSGQTSATATPQILGSQRLVESAMAIVRDEARKAEQQIAAQEKKRLNSPIGMLEQNLRQTRKETRLANGMLKIVTDAGTTVCFQPVPSYARDARGLYGIPVTCP